MSSSVKKRKGLNGIQVRDIERALFLYLYENKVATACQIARDIFTDRSHQALYKRLNQLVRKGYVERRYHVELGRQLTYNLSESAFRKFVTSDRAACSRVQLKTDSVLHDLALNDIRSRFTSINSVTRYYPENVLRSGAEVNDSSQLDAFKTHRFDAVVKIEKHGSSQLLALEFERSRKFGKRYEQYFRKLYANPEIKAVLFIGYDRSLIDYVMTKERDAITNAWPKVFYATLGDLNSSAGPLTFSNLNNETITLT
jgi:DNA-binding MarR family transcriptional regulator